MFPCLWKKTFNIDCMGCGMQRALVLVFQGEFQAAFRMYPAIYTLILLFIVLLLHLKFQFKHGAKILLVLFILNISIIIISYLIKIT
ncbi:MAG: DUF2752 domain-containing protein [Bacteroidia bacterium]|nr:DUF2752 domain-containing protein [Bacteroidia bacterium]NND52573.1 DUF2752 domain-containing protein [Flavobacteriaceae bacterium]